MKKTPLALICLSLLLSACGAETREPEETDMIETTAAMETAASVSETSFEAFSETLSETDNEIIKPVIIDEREAVPDGFTPALEFNEFADEGYYYGSHSVSGSDVLLVCFCYDPNRGDEIKPCYLVGISLTDKKQLFRIDAPSSDCYFDLTENITDGEKSACAALEKIGGEKVSLIEFDKDGNYKITEEAGSDDIVYSWGDRAVKTVNGSIVNALDGSVLCQRYDEENDPDFVNSKVYRFSMPLDNDRFIYQMFGYEWSEGAGIYDLSTSTSVNFPDSMNTAPLGVHNGMVYTVDSFDGVGENIYITDPATLEKKLFCGSPYELQMNDMLYYEMPSSGEFILAVYAPWFEREENAKLALLSPDTGEIMTEYTLPDIPNYYPPFFTDNYICLFDYTDDIIYTLPMPRGEFSLEDKGDSTELCYTYLGKSETLRAYDNTQMWNLSSCTVKDFNDVMGYDGVIYTETAATRYWSENFYLSVIDGKPVCIAESFGNGDGENDSIADIDGDGINELICNCIYGADGAQVCYIYKITDEGIMRASGHDLMGEEILKMQVVAGNTSSEYLPEKNKMLCGYFEDEEYVTAEYDIDMSALNFEPFVSSFFDVPSDE
ncbi:MAG: hypothetical protein ACI4J0_11525 [Huintestinicola sp.]|uniref:hypothetical protein n=1 Tax=Huintestinicola sp. TaxID=2981661 RepID=UPI003F091584